MQRSSPRTIAVLVLCFAAGVVAVLLLTGGDDEPVPSTGAIGTPTQATRPSTPAGDATTAAGGSSTRTTASTATEQASASKGSAAAPLEVSPEEIAKRSKAQAGKAKEAGARSCPDIGAPDAGAINITAKGVSCATVKTIIFATAGKARRGFTCEIESESFADVPTIVYACKRKADTATIDYTAIG